ncbi:MAG: glucose-1-phosphate adenylyltransferase subunit GlgD [Ruminococcaceae bacterium]|nr:glucose-1-phosphate adenylyltransferase subunit GlgD [Oscillospiraceae bacterium]
MNVMGIIFANDATLSALTDRRTMASLPFGGRYRLVDFHLSNLAAAGIRHVGIITRHNYQSLMNHIGSGEEWGLTLEEGGLEFLTPYAMSATDNYHGKLEAIHEAMSFLDFGPEDEYVIVCDSAILSNIDMETVLDAHVASGKDVTVVTKAGIADGTKQLDLALKLDDNGEILDIAVDYIAPADYLASMDIFVMKKKYLRETVQEFIARNLFHMDRDLIMGQWQKNAITINVFQFQGVALFNESVDEFYQNSLSLVDPAVRHDVFGRNHPIFTKVRDRVPTYYGDKCSVKNAIVADGCMLEGNVENSVLFRQVTVNEGAHVESCIIMNDAVIGEGAELKYVILDKDTNVRPGSKLIGTPKHPIVIKRGETV